MKVRNAMQHFFVTPQYLLVNLHGFSQNMKYIWSALFRQFLPPFGFSVSDFCLMNFSNMQTEAANSHFDFLAKRNRKT